MTLSVLWLLSCAGALVGTVIAREMYMWFRNLIPKSVQCWFCLHKTEVPYSLSNSWHCPKCEQYNGFTKEGDYNKPIEQQYVSELNFSVSALGRCKNAWSREKSLCNTCNRNQELKVEQLAKFVPLNDRNYDKEVEHFRAQIEKAYKLCPYCEALLHSVLKKEREEYCVPRRLNASLVAKDQSGTWIVMLNIFVGLSLSLMGFIQTRGASRLKKEIVQQGLPWLKEQFPTFYSNLTRISPSAIKSASVLVSDYVVLIGAVLSLVAYYRTQRKPGSLLFNSLTWIIFLVVSLYNENGLEWMPLCQIALGAVYCILSFVVLGDIYSDVRDQQHKQQTFLQPKASKSFSYSPKLAPNGTSTPRGSPPTKSAMPTTLPTDLSNYSETTINSMKTASTSIRAPSVSGRDIGLEPRIRGLTLGSPSPRMREDDVHSLWGGCPPSFVNGTSYAPNSSSWTLYSSGPNLTTQSAPILPGLGHGPLSHVYTANSVYANQSRPTSPAQSLSSLFTSNMNTHHPESDVRRRNASNTIVYPPRLVLDSNSSSGVSSLPESDSQISDSDRLASRFAARIRASNPYATSRTEFNRNCLPPVDSGNYSCSIRKCCVGTSCHSTCYSVPPPPPNPQVNCSIVVAVGFLSIILCNVALLSLMYRNSLLSFDNLVHN